MSVKSIVVLGSDPAAKLAADRAHEINHDARVVMIEQSSPEHVSLDMESRSVTVSADGKSQRIAFDSLIFCGGKTPRKLEIPGLLQNDYCYGFTGLNPPLEKRGVSLKSAVILGCSPDGIAIAQQLKKAGLSVSIVEKSSRILNRFSFESAQRILRALHRLGIEVRLQEEVVRGEKLPKGSYRLRTLSGSDITADLIVSAVGAIPNNALLAEAGAMISSDGTIFVDDAMSTTLNRVFACGSSVSIVKAISGNRDYRPSASMIERGAQIAGANAANPGKSTIERMRPVASKEVIQVGDKFFGRTGLSHLEVHQLFAYDEAVRATVASEDSVARFFALRENGSLLGAELIGDSRLIPYLDVISLVVTKRLLASDLIDTDVPSIIREAAEHIRSAMGRESESISGENLALWLVEQRPFQWLDVGDSPSAISGNFQRTMHVPLKELKRKISELPCDTPTVVASKFGKSAMQAYRILKKSGRHKIFHLEGGANALELLLGKPTN